MNVIKYTIGVLFLGATSAYAQQIGSINCNPSGPNPTIAIYTAQDLNDFAQCVNSGNSEMGVIVKLMNNIDTESMNFKPIGTSATPFQGIFDGQFSNSQYATISSNYTLFRYAGPHSVIRNLKITNLNLECSSQYYCGGLVAYLNDGIVSNVVISGSMTSSNSNLQKFSIGGLVGYSKNGIITHSGTNVNILVSNSSTPPSATAGLVGYQDGGEIDSSYSLGGIVNQASNNTLGGLVGMQRIGIIDSSYSTGSITSEVNVRYAGGLIGLTLGGTTSNCFSLANVSAKNNASGIAALIGGVSSINDEVSIINSYATGAIIGESSSTQQSGGLVSVTSPSYAINCVNSYWNTETTGQSTSAACPNGGRTTAQMVESANYQNWDFSSIWGINPSVNNGYPYLYSNHMPFSN